VELNLHHYIEIFALIISVFCIRQLKHTALVWFIPYLLLIVIVELSGKYTAHVLHQPNAWIYNLSVPIEYLFYSFIFYSEVSSRIFKRLIVVLACLFLFYIIYSLLTSRWIIVFNAGFLLRGSGMMLLFCCLFFWDLFSRAEEINLLTHPYFWIAAGLFLFNLGEFSYNLFADLLFNRGDKGAVFFRQINNYLNLVLYICISTGLLCRKLLTKA
jgi:hypothetical protein